MGKNLINKTFLKLIFQDRPHMESGFFLMFGGLCDMTIFSSFLHNTNRMLNKEALSELKTLQLAFSILVPHRFFVRKICPQDNYTLNTE